MYVTQEKPSRGAAGGAKSLRRGATVRGLRAGAATC